ncbi:MAG: Crp/Fnr family transcriptional regulator [Fulvimarina manganoxydans]|uniref:Crp/Fnr family transcriptional regulator n=1 Tax=Fulvimarina manganoxydans TaxID=937218 RepID=UPI002352139C|nr:Crp/Fnr family transcriptional regulator [Fulvimarina manganoxydans]MCK5930715.1 Crp/Fnr family transcriptional regulator [Fulvimarina manganoxydans]
MFNPLARKLSLACDFEDVDRQILDDIISQSRKVGPRKDIIREGDLPDDVHLVIEGFACRYKILPNGNRQIVAFLVPGDFCDLHVAILGEMDHGIATLTPCRMVEIPRETIEELTTSNPRIARAFWWATLVDEAVLREWLAGMGQRSADRQLAHLICELYLRLKSVGLVNDHSFQMPLTQQELGDAMGLSIVHTNRMMTELRTRQFVSIQGRQIRILDVEGLTEFAQFNPNYLHLKRHRVPDEVQAFFGD